MTNIIKDYLSLNDWRVKENSNMNYSLQGLNFHISSKITAQYWLEQYSEEIKNAHIKGDFHIHDLSILGPYCVGWDLQDLLMQGFGGVSSKVESKPPKHFRTALGQIVNFFYTLQGECMCKNTEVLTKDGWKFFKDIDKDNDTFATINTITKKIEYQKCTDYIEKDSTNMIHFLDTKTDLMVTPDHKMLVAKYNPDLKKKNYDLTFVKAKDFNTNTHLIPTKSIWEGIEKTTFTIPSITRSKYLNPDILINEIQKSITVNMDDWLAFFGLWITGGSTNKTLNTPEKGNEYYDYTIIIKQTIGENHKPIEDLLNKLSFKWNKTDINGNVNYCIYGKQLYSYLAQFGKSKDKFIPKEFKALSKRQLEILFKWMMFDQVSKNDSYEYYTPSYKLKDDIQEIVLKLGIAANVISKSPNLKSKDLESKDLEFFVKTFSKANYVKVASCNINTVPYCDKVYCVTVPNSTLYVRRNGKAIWCGNCAGAQAFSSFDTLLAPFIRYDKLTYKEVKQSLQEFIFNLNVPTRVGFQCMSEDTKILTESGWEDFSNIKIGDLIATINIETEKVEYKPVQRLFQKFYNGIMYNLKNKNTDQLISPKHRVVRRTDEGNLILEEIENCLTQKELIIPQINSDIIDTLPFPCVKKQDLIKKNLHVDRGEIKQINYKGIIWCPTTDNNTVIAKRNNHIFITGNTPFTNITMDLIPSPNYKESPVVIGGKVQDSVYGEYQEEMNMINKALSVLMSEGDAKGRIFTFPIPTYNITSDFDFNDPKLIPFWEMVGKYGIPYFSNFVNSNMKPDQVTSMCPLDGSEKVLVQDQTGDIHFKEIETIHQETVQENKKYNIYAEDAFVEGSFNKFKDQSMIKVVLVNNHELIMSQQHLNFVLKEQDESIKEIIGKNLTKKMFLPYSLKKLENKEQKDDELGYLVGLFASIGKVLNGDSILFTFNKDSIVNINVTITKLQKLLVKEFNILGEGKNNTILVKSKAVLTVCKNFVGGDNDTKHYKPIVFKKSIIFRKEILKGHLGSQVETTIKTKSKLMIESLNMIFVTIGEITQINKSETDYSLSLLPATSCFKQNQKLWVKIKEIIPLENKNAYCFEVKNKEPLFTTGSGILTHNCRLRIDHTELQSRGGGLFGSNPKTGSLGVVTINMARLGYISEDMQDLYRRLDILLNLAKDSLLHKRKIIEDLTNKGLFPYISVYLKSVKDSSKNWWSNHFNTIGIIGFNEACLNFLGKDILTKEGHQFTKTLLQYIREKIQEFQIETKSLFNLEATPAEGASYRLAKKDKELYPQIITQGSTIPFYTNSVHIPAKEIIDIFDLLEHQDELQTLFTGGTVVHLYLGEAIQDYEVVRDLVKKVVTNFKLPYFSITPTFSICPVHGYISGEKEYCPFEHTIGDIEKYGEKLKLK